MQERLKVYEEKMNKSYDALLNEYTSIRAGRANPHVLEGCQGRENHLGKDLDGTCHRVRAVLPQLVDTGIAAAG